MLHNSKFKSAGMLERNDLAIAKVVLKTKDLFFPIADVANDSFNPHGREFFRECGNNRLGAVITCAADKLKDAHGLHRTAVCSICAAHLHVSGKKRRGNTLVSCYRVWTALHNARRADTENRRPAPLRTPCLRMLNEAVGRWRAFQSYNPARSARWLPFSQPIGRSPPVIP